MTCIVILPNGNIPFFSNWWKLIDLIQILTAGFGSKHLEHHLKPVLPAIYIIKHMSGDIDRPFLELEPGGWQAYP